MTFEEFHTLQSSKSDIILPEDLESLGDRTLIYGYTCKRDTFHFYLKDGVFHRYVYNRDGTVSYEAYGFAEPSMAIPDKRAYPERCDLDFCKLVLMTVGYIPFTVWTKDVEEKQFYGEVYEDDI